MTMRMISDNFSYKIIFCKVKNNEMCMPKIMSLLNNKIYVYIHVPCFVLQLSTSIFQQPGTSHR